MESGREGEATRSSSEIERLEEQLATERAERAHLEQQLREADARYERLYQDTPVMLHSIDREGRLISVSDHWLKVLGYERAEVLGRPSTDFLTEESKRYAREVILPSFFQTGVCTDVLYEMVTREREIRYVLLSAIAELDAEGRHFRSFAVIIDITEQKRIEAEFHQSQKLQSLGVLAGGIAHDFNNLLMGMYGFIDLALLEAPRESQLHDYLVQAKKTAQLSSGLIDQLLLYAGRRKGRRSAIDLRSLISDMGELLRSFISKKTTLEFDLPADAPMVEGDATQLRQVIVNLVTNAAQAIGDEPGTIVLSLRAPELNQAQVNRLWAGSPMPPGQYVCLSVQDSGPGLSESLRGKIFDPFFTTKVDGSGLGLAVVHGIVRGHRGAIKIESVRGARFSIYLPVSSKRTDTVSKPKSDFSWKGSGLVLLADDEPFVRDATRILLDRLGFDVLSASDGAEAVEMFRAHAQEICCVLLDRKMPKLDGEETFRAIREIRPDIAVVLASGYAAEDTTLQLESEGLADYIQKPFTLATLRATLARLLPPAPVDD